MARMPWPLVKLVKSWMLLFDVVERNQVHHRFWRIQRTRLVEQRSRKTLGAKLIDRTYIYMYFIFMYYIYTIYVYIIMYLFILCTYLQYVCYVVCIYRIYMIHIYITTCFLPSTSQDTLVYRIRTRSRKGPRPRHTRDPLRVLVTPAKFPKKKMEQTRGLWTIWIWRSEYDMCFFAEISKWDVVM